MSWYKILLYGNAVEKQERIVTLFKEACMANPTIQDAALFADSYPGDPYAMYFSPASFSIPACIAIIMNYYGVPCEKPKASSVKLIVGRDNAGDLLKD